MRGLSLAWRWLKRDLAAGELTVIALALVIATASMSSVGLFASRISEALAREANQLMAADLVLNSERPISPQLAASQSKLQHTRSTSMMSMLQSGEQVQLVTVKAVGPGYPLRGQLRLGSPLQSRRVQGPPPAGHAWADQRLFDALGLAPGAQVQLGEASLRLDAVLAREPDGAMDLYNFIPRLMINEQDLPATQLIQPGSRVRYRLLLAGEAADISRAQQALQKQLTPGQRLEDVREARPEVKQALERAERFLRLSALLGVFMAAAAIALAARAYSERHLDSVALLRTLGLQQSQIEGLFLRQYALLALFAISGGILIGYLAQWGLAALLKDMFQATLPPPGIQAALLSAGLSLCLLLGFCLPALLRLRDVAPLRVLRRDLTPPGRARLAFGLGATSISILMLVQAADLKLAALALLGLFGSGALAAGSAYLLLYLLPRLPRLGLGWHFGLANLARRQGLSIAQIVALSLGFSAILLLTVVRYDLLAAWQHSLPPHAPNRFMLNVQTEQRPLLSQRFAQNQLPAPQFSPMIRARLSAINGREVKPEQFSSDNAKRLVQREFNLSWGLPERVDNQLAAGHMPSDEQPGWSVEEGLGKTLGLKLGQILSFEIDGQRLQAPIIGFRKVNWDTFKVNFFVTGNRALLEPHSASHVASFYLGPEQARFNSALIREFPNLTIIDVSVIVQEVRAILDKVFAAIQAVFVFSIAGGLLVLYAATLATHDERKVEAAILRTLGASSRIVKQASSAELWLVGAVSGLLAAICALALGSIAAQLVFDLPMQHSWWLLLAAPLLGALITRLAAAPLLQRVLQTPPLQVLRS